MGLFTKQSFLPEPLRQLRYDPHSVMHFDQRAYSKNGHRTIMFRDKDFVQHRNTLTETDLKKIDLVYSNECLIRDRLQKIDMCQNFVDVTNDRKKRDLSSIVVLKSLRPNPNITPPPNTTEDTNHNIDVEKKLDVIVEEINEIANQTLDFLRKQLCNGTEPLSSRRTEVNYSNSSTPIKDAIEKYLINTVHNTTANRTEFCKRNNSNPLPMCLGDTCQKPIENLGPKRVKRQIFPTEFEFDATFNIQRKNKHKKRSKRTNEEKGDGKSNGDNSGNGEKLKEKEIQIIKMNRNSDDDDDDDDEGDTNGALRLTKLNEGFYEDRRWPGRIVPYVIDENLKNEYNLNAVRKSIEEVNDILKKKTCVKLIETEEGKNQYQDYLVINTNDDYVTGHVGGRQEFGSLELFQGGQHRQHAAMMVMAMLGFYFEVSRHDRDEYVRVHDRHIRPEKLHHFEKIKEEATLDLPYDYASATHPSWQFWRTLGRKGVSSVATYKNMDPSGIIMQSLGQNEKLLSDVDIIKINAVYNCK